MNLVNIFLTLDGIGTGTGFCYQTANVWQIVGYALLVFKIVIPILLIIFGILDLGKAVMASKEDEIKKATGSLLRRAIAAVVIFLIPTIVTFLVGMIGGFNGEAKDDYEVCKSCINNPIGGCANADTLWGKEKEGE